VCGGIAGPWNLWAKLHAKLLKVLQKATFLLMKQGLVRL
jgi:hypothetical protein